MPGIGEPSNAEQPGFDTESAARLRRVIVRLARTLNDSASTEGLSPSQASVLAVIGARGPLALAALAEFEGINPTMLSRIVTKLDGDGLIRRMPNPDDQRAALVEATERGRETSERIRAARTADLGAQDPALWCVDDHGFPYHESGLVVTARDLARVGQLILDNGVPTFTARSLEATPPATTLDRTTVGYHNAWWVLPGHDLAAMGDHGQIMIVSPGTDTVVVRMGDDDGGNIELAGTLQNLAHRTAT